MPNVFEMSVYFFLFLFASCIQLLAFSFLHFAVYSADAQTDVIQTKKHKAKGKNKKQEAKRKKRKACRTGHYAWNHIKMAIRITQFLEIPKRLINTPED